MTTLEHLQTLPDEIRQKFINNVWALNEESYAKWFFKKETETLQKTLFGIFDFEASKEGWEYWKSIVNKYT